MMLKILPNWGVRRWRVYLDISKGCKMQPGACMAFWWGVLGMVWKGKEYFSWGEYQYEKVGMGIISVNILALFLYLSMISIS